MMKRLFDLCLALFALIFLLLPILLVALMVRFTSVGPIFYWSDRVGRFNQIFKMPKFRTMLVDTPAVATHLLLNPAQFLTPIGSFLRKSSPSRARRKSFFAYGPKPFLPKDLILKFLSRLITLASEESPVFKN